MALLAFLVVASCQVAVVWIAWVGLVVGHLAAGTVVAVGPCSLRVDPAGLVGPIVSAVVPEEVEDIDFLAACLVAAVGRDIAAAPVGSWMVVMSVVCWATYHLVMVAVVGRPWVVEADQG